MPEDPRLRVLHCIPSVDGGGAEKQVALLAPLLSAQGLDIHLAARFTDQEMDFFTRCGVVCHRLPNGHHLAPRFLAATWRTVSRVKPDLVHAWLTPMIVTAGAAASTLGIPWVLSECSSQACYGGLKERLRQAIGRKAHAVAASGRTGLDVWPRTPIGRVVSSAVDIDAISRARMVTGLQGFVVLSACRLVASKRVDLLIRAVAGKPGILLVLLGDGPERARLQDLAQRLGVNALFLGHRADVANWMKAADIFASASEYEGLPSAVLEAAAAGAPLLLSDIPAHREAAGDGALYVTDLGAGIERLRADAALRRSLAKRAARHVRPMAAELVTEQLIDLYREVTGAEVAPDHAAYAFRKVA